MILALEDVFGHTDRSPFPRPPMEPLPKAPLLFPILPCQPATKCRSCGAPGYWIITANGRRMFVEVLEDVPGAVAPSKHEPGAGTAHFATCPDAAEWRRERERPAPAKTRPKRPKRPARSAPPPADPERAP